MTDWLTPLEAAHRAKRKQARTVKRWFPHGLKYCRLPSGHILIKKEWLDQFLESRCMHHPSADEIANTIVEKFKRKQ